MVISAGKFKARCLKLMDQVNETHETITITKRGRPVAKLVPHSEEKSTRVLGYMKGLVERANAEFAGDGEQGHPAPA